MDNDSRENRPPASLSYSLVDQKRDFDAIQTSSFVIVAIDYELSLKKLYDPDVDKETSAMRPKKYLAVVTDKSIDMYGTIPAYKLNLYLVGREEPSNMERGLFGGECIPICPNDVHLEDRKPLVPEGHTPFPYSDCYIYTTATLRCHLAKTHVEESGALPKKAIRHLGLIQMVDKAHAYIHVAIYEDAGWASHSFSFSLD